MALTARQALFVREYLTDHNGTQAAIRAGYSEKTARAIASENLRKPAVAAEIARGRARLRKRLDVTAEKITDGLAEIAFSNMAEAIQNDGSLLPIEEWPREFLAAAQDVRWKIPGRARAKAKGSKVIKVKMQNKVKALEILAKRLGLFVDRSSQKK